MQTFMLNVIVLFYFALGGEGAGYARRITFEKIRFVRANSPIVIDQFYFPLRSDCQNQVPQEQ